MELSNLPTDNMYKFIALSGLLILIFVIVYPYSKKFEILLEIKRIQGAMEEVGSEIKYFKSLTPDERTVQSENIHKLDLQTIRTHTKLNEAQVRNDQLEFFRQIWSIGTVVGVFLFLSGFILWYWKVQRYQDKLLRAQATRDN